MTKKKKKKKKKKLNKSNVQWLLAPCLSLLFYRCLSGLLLELQYKKVQFVILLFKNHC